MTTTFISSKIFPNFLAVILFIPLFSCNRSVEGIEINNPIEVVTRIFDTYNLSEESTDSQDNLDSLVQAFKLLEKKIDSKDLTLIINVWMYYTVTDFPIRELTEKVLLAHKDESIKAVQERMIKKMKWENSKNHPFSELKYLLDKLEYTAVTLDDFELGDPPENYSQEWYDLNYSEYSFKVFMENGKLNISVAKKFNKETLLKIETGTLQGIYKGEWGGYLNFISNTSSNKNVKIKEGCIRFLYNLNDQTYFVEGLAHGSTSEGVLYRLETKNRDFKYHKVIDFDDAPEAFLVKGNKVYMASHAGFFVIDSNLVKRKIFKDMFWNSLYPNSVAIKNDSIAYIGIRGGYVELNLKNKEMRFFKYKKLRSRKH